MIKYYEIYVGGKNGFSIYVKTDIKKHDEDEILNRAVAAKVIEGGDAKEICYGCGYVVELTKEELRERQFDKCFDKNITHDSLKGGFYYSI